MYEFVLRGKNGSFILITINEAFGFPNCTSHFGGYDVKGTVEIKSGSYNVNGELWFSTGEVYEFYNQIIKCWSDLEGIATFINSEANFKIEVMFNKYGQVTIEGYYKEFLHENNELKYEIESNQSFFLDTIDGMKKIVSHYGGFGGIHKD